MIIFEHALGINKATSALLMAVIMWAFQFADRANANWHMEELLRHLSDVSQVIIFLLGALTIVETIHMHGGLNFIARLVRVRSKRLSIWVIGFTAFFLSSILDNLTTTIVMVMMLRKLLAHTQDRLLFGSIVVIAANAGGAWTPIGDVTTTMLWVGGQLSTLPIMSSLFLPSVVCLAVALLWFSFILKGNLEFHKDIDTSEIAPQGKLVFVAGILALIFVPIIKMLTGLPPFMGMLLSMSVLWCLTDILHARYEERQHLRLISIFPRVDLSGIFFFLGILLAVDALETSGQLRLLATWFDHNIPSKTIIATVIGIVSAVIDNVPLVAACMGMYELTTFPTDHSFWQLIAYCAGTGGSMLIIGSAAGVAFMGIEKVDFFWYLKRATIPAALGYFAGIGVYLFFQ
jgi:Na+/H+ antiporter NhaD/arsenite permease-like protein